MLPIWRNRPVTVANLLNPAFCGEIINNFIKEYNKVNPAESGLPFILAFVVLPLVLHQDIRYRLPKTTRKSLTSWLADNQDLKIEIPSHIKNVTPYTKEAIMFLMVHNIIQINDQGKINTTTGKKSKYKPEGVEVKECLMKAEFIGKWLAKSGSEKTIITTLGIKP